MELYWSLVSHLAMVIILFLEGWFFYRFSNPFLHKEKCGKVAGIGYLAVMLVWKESVSEIRTGNPVTDVVLMEKQKEAKEKGIAFQCQFSYPVHTNVNAFDISVILNNALANAIEAAEGCEPAFVTIYSYRKKNAYMVEVRNSIKENVVLDKETSLPQTSKKDKENHGFGLVNIRKVAQKYYGDFAIEQKENCFMLTILLMVESDLKCD